MPLEQEPGWIAAYEASRLKAKRQREAAFHRRLTSACILVLSVLAVALMIGVLRVVW